jgi:hypothetical protein
MENPDICTGEDVIKEKKKKKKERIWNIQEDPDDSNRLRISEV